MLKVKLLSVFLSALVLLCPVFCIFSSAEITRTAYQISNDEKHELSLRTKKENEPYKGILKVDIATEETVWQKIKRKCMDILKGSAYGVINGIQFPIIIINMPPLDSGAIFMTSRRQLLINVIGGAACGLVGVPGNQVVYFISVLLATWALRNPKVSP